MELRKTVLTYTTNGSGAATATATLSTLGRLYAVEYRPGTTDTGATITLTSESGTSKPLLTKASAGTANSWYYPRDLVHAVADGAALTGTAGGDRTLPLICGVLKLVVASGGDSKSGSMVVYYE